MPATGTKTRRTRDETINLRASQRQKALIDSAAGCAGHTLLPAGVGYASVETKANFTRPIKHDTGRVRAEGRVVGRGRQIMSAEARILDSAGRVLAHGTSTMMVLGKSEERTPAAAK